LFQCLKKEIHSRIESFIIGPSYDNLVNIGTCDYAHFHLKGKYCSVMSHESKSSTPSLFYTVGIISYSDLMTGKNSHQIYIVPSDLNWTHIATVMGKFFEQKKPALQHFQNIMGMWDFFGRVVQMRSQNTTRTWDSLQCFCYSPLLEIHPNAVDNLFPMSQSKGLPIIAVDSLTTQTSISNPIIIWLTS